MTIRLALIGRDISHSKSEVMYRKILSINFEYTLLDYKIEDDIPRVEDLFLKFYGVSITAPYKKHFLDQVILSEDIQAIGAINCLSKIGENYYGHNTDYEAIKEILAEMSYLEKKIIILGNGAMANVIEYILKSNNKEYKKYSRKVDGDISKLDLSQISQKNALVINCCSRDFNFTGKISSDSIFWDLNYSHAFHKENVSEICSYVDGEELLFRQAKHAVKIWGIQN